VPFAGVGGRWRDALLGRCTRWVTVAIFLLIGLWRGKPQVRRGCKWSLAGLVGGAILFLPWFPDVSVPEQAHRHPLGSARDLRRRRPRLRAVAGGAADGRRALLVVVCALLALSIFGYPAGKRQVLIDLKGHEPGRLLFLLAITTLVLAVTVRQAGRQRRG